MTLCGWQQETLYYPWMHQFPRVVPLPAGLQIHRVWGCAPHPRSPQVPSRAHSSVPDSGISSPDHQVHFQGPHGLMCASERTPWPVGTRGGQKDGKGAVCWEGGWSLPCRQQQTAVWVSVHLCTRTLWKEQGGGAMLRDSFPEASRAQEAIYQVENRAEGREGQTFPAGRAAL